MIKPIMRGDSRGEYSLEVFVNRPDLICKLLKNKISKTQVYFNDLTGKFHIIILKLLFITNIFRKTDLTFA